MRVNKPRFEDLYQEAMIELGKRSGAHTGEVFDFLHKTEDEERIRTFLLTIRNQMDIKKGEDITRETNVYFCRVLAMAFASLETVCGHLEEALRAEEVVNG